MEAVVIGFSGGADSALLAKVAHDELGARAIAVIALSESYPKREKEEALGRFLTGLPHRFETATGVVTFNSVLVTISTPTGRAISIQRIDREHI